MDEHFSLTTRIALPASEVFAWHERPGALGRLCPPWEHVEVVAATGGVQAGARVTVRNKMGPFWMEWRMEHRDYVAGRQFRDVQLSGPFARWEHLHLIEPDGPEACHLTDEIAYRLPLGGLGRLFGRGLARAKLNQLFAWRHATTKADLELAPATARAAPQTVLIAGASGLIGRALAPFLQTQGHRVMRLVRRPAQNADEIQWDPATGVLDSALLEGVDAMINLSGENVGAGRWTKKRREAIFRSRVDSTRTLVTAMQRMKRKPAVLVGASAVGFYGDRGAEILAEDSAIGQGFLSDVCLAWETNAEAARAVGVRTPVVRFGVVLSPAGGALAKLMPVFKAGVGGPVGTGDQWMSWISIDDVVGAIYHAMVDETCKGPMNGVAPAPVTNREFTAILGKVLHRPAVVPVPAVALRMVFGEMADGTLLASTRAVPKRLLAAGYRFRHPDLETALRHVLGRSSLKT